MIHSKPFETDAGLETETCPAPGGRGKHPRRGTVLLFAIPLALLAPLLGGCIAPEILPEDRPGRLDEAWVALRRGEIDTARAIFRRFDTPGREGEVRGEAIFGLGLCMLSDEPSGISEEAQVTSAVASLQNALTFLRGGPLEAPCSFKLGESYAWLRATDLADRHLARSFPFLDGPERVRAAALLAVIATERGDEGRAHHWWSQAGEAYDTPRFRRIRDRILAPPEVTPVIAELPGESRRVQAAPPPNPWPPIVSRKDWKAVPWKGERIEPMRRITRITIHHTADSEPPEVQNVADGAEYLRVQQHHAQKNLGWADIGYHFVIDKQGTIYECRPLEFQGAHAGDNRLNRGNVGIAVIGNYDRRRPPRAQFEALRKLVSAVRREYDVPGSRVEGHRIVRERAGKKTTICPGVYMERLLPELRAD